MAYSRIRIEDAGRHTGEPVEVAGWLYNLRKSGKIVFPLLRDGTGTIQAVAVKANLDEATFEALKNLTQESSLILRGKVRPEQRAPGGYEMDVEGAEIVQPLISPDYGGKSFGCRDLEGHIWWVGSYDPWAEYKGPTAEGTA